MWAAALLGCLWAGAAPVQAALTQPWDPLVMYTDPGGAGQWESWLRPSNQDPTLPLYTVNGGTYGVGFDLQNKKGQASGMKALTFSYQGASTGHMVAQTPAGQFSVLNTGDNRTFTDLVLLVAIDADSLPATFAMSLGLAGQAAGYDASDFVWYDPAALGYLSGRPAGYFGETSPTREDLAYDFTAGMISLIALRGADLGPQVGSAPGEAVIDYAFTDLPGRAVFSVYGYDDARGWIYHTNRSTLETGNESTPISTFEVPATVEPGGRPIPEPMTLWLTGLAGCALIGYVRRRR